MSLSDVLTAHADAFRQKTGVSGKLTIADMTRLLGDLTWGQSNLLQGTSDQYKEFTGIRYLGITSANTALHNLDEATGTYYTYAATVTNKSSKNIRLEYWAMQSNGHPLATHSWSGKAAPGTVDIPISVTFEKISDAARLYIVNDYPVTDTESILVKDERLYVGTEPGIWTPNPADKVGGDK